MAEYPLRPHSTTPSSGIEALRVHVQRTASGLLICRYVVVGGAGALQVPPPGQARHVDGLWQGTCFEAFLRIPGARSYVEINASPSTEWAVYGFDDYRAGMRVLTLDRVPGVRCRYVDAILEVEVTIGLGELGLATGGPVEIGLAAILQHGTGVSSCWALTHPEARPDFHHPESFVLTLHHADSQS